MTATVEQTKQKSFLAQELAHTHYWRAELPETAQKRSFSQVLKEELAATGYWRNRKNLIGQPSGAVSTTVRTS